MKNILFILSLLIFTPLLFGNSSKTLCVVLPPTVMGNISDTEKQFLLNTLDNELSIYFDVSPHTQIESDDLPVVSDVFQLKIVEEDGDTRLSLRWMSGDEMRAETKLCEGCMTIELNGKLKELIEKLVEVKNVDEKPEVVVEKRQKEILYYGYVNRKWGWFKSGADERYTKYLGEIKNGEPNGQGTYTSPLGWKYIGEWKDGVKHGQGAYTSPLGSKYVGKWKDGVKHGQGAYTYLYDGKYVGEWKDGVKHGLGIHTLPDGNKYKEKSKDEVRDDQGIFTFIGEKMIGEFRNEKPWNVTSYDKNGKIIGKHVNGEETFESKIEAVLFSRKEKGIRLWFEKGEEGKVEKYEGEIEKGKPNGQGTYTFNDGRKYVGEYKDGTWNGQGTYTFPDGKKWVGEFRDDSPWNITEYDKNGKISGKFVNGEINLDGFTYVKERNEWIWIESPKNNQLGNQ